MCYNCGCRRSTDDMGNPDNITEDMLTHVAAEMGKTQEQLKKDIYTLLASQEASKFKDPISDPKLKTIFEKAAGAWGQSIEEAKKNTYELLKKQLQA